MKKDKSFAKISAIKINEKICWQQKIFLTFDIDWAADEVIEDTLSLCAGYDVPITIFATHSSPTLLAIDKEKIEVGLHPNFNKLLHGDSTEDFRAICESLKNIYPSAVSVRSHSLCFGSLIQTAYADLGITHDSSLIVPYQNNNTPLHPWIMWDGLIRAPYFFCDYITAMTSSMPISDLIAREGLKIFDFHPIHVFLNTENLDRYELTRSLHQNPKELIKHRYDGYGTRNRLIDLLELSKKI